MIVPEVGAVLVRFWYALLFTMIVSIIVSV